MHASMESAGQVTSISGAASGIEEALARAFPARGARLALPARRELARGAGTCRAADGAALAGQLRERQSAD